MATAGLSRKTKLGATAKAAMAAAASNGHATKMIYYFGRTKTEGTGKQKQLLGGKGANLAEMTSIGLPVPPGFTITTEVCDLYYKSGRKLPAGEASLPYAMAGDDKGRIWVAETGVRPNRLVAFDPSAGKFTLMVDTEGGDQPNTIRHMVFSRPEREIWYGTDRNTIGRLEVP